MHTRNRWPFIGRPFNQRHITCSSEFSGGRISFCNSALPVGRGARGEAYKRSRFSPRWSPARTLHSRRPSPYSCEADTVPGSLCPTVGPTPVALGVATQPLANRVEVLAAIYVSRLRKRKLAELWHEGLSLPADASAWRFWPRRCLGTRNFEYRYFFRLSFVQLVRRDPRIRDPRQFLPAAK